MRDVDMECWDQTDNGGGGGGLLWIVWARSANRSAPQEAPALIIILDSLMLKRSA